MARWTRRDFLAGTARTAAAATTAAVTGASCGLGRPEGADGEDGLADRGPAVVSLDGNWRFRTAPEDRGHDDGWTAPGAAKDGWDEVAVPSTWQVAEATDALAQQGKIGLRPVKGGVMLYLPGEGPEMSRGDMALKKMGLLEKP